MKMRMSFVAVVAALSLGGLANADTVSWTDWTDASSNSAVGTMGSVGVSFSGPLFFAQTNNQNNYWANNGTYVTPLVGNAPPFDILAITGDSTYSLTFSAPVTGLVMAIVSLGQPGLGTQYAFNQSFQVLQFGPGSFGAGPLTNIGANGFGGQTLQGNEGHGLIFFPGTFTTLTWVGANPEAWNGFTVGIVPAPGAAALLVGAGALVARRRR
jgi:hypothetical protein